MPGVRAEAQESGCRISGGQVGGEFITRSNQKDSRPLCFPLSRCENAEYDRYELRTLQRIVGACGGRLDIILEPGSKTHRAA